MIRIRGSRASRLAAAALVCATVGIANCARSQEGSDVDGTNESAIVGDGDCGAQALTVALAQLGRPTKYRELSGALGPIPSELGGYSLGQLAERCEALGLRTRLVRTNLDRLAWRRPPFACVAHVDDGTHFVAVVDSDASRRSVDVFDPNAATKSEPIRTLDYEAFEHRWAGIALLISPSELQAEDELRGPLGWKLPAALVATVALIVGGLLFVRRRRDP